MTLGDRAFISEQLPDVPYSENIVTHTKHATDEYVIATIYFPGEKGKSEQKVLAAVTHVDNLRAHLLIGNDIIAPESISIDRANSKAHIGSCDVNIDSKPRGQYLGK